MFLSNVLQNIRYFRSLKNLALNANDFSCTCVLEWTFKFRLLLPKKNSLGCSTRWLSNLPLVTNRFAPFVFQDKLVSRSNSFRKWKRNIFTFILFFSCKEHLNTYLCEVSLGAIVNDYINFSHVLNTFWKKKEKYFRGLLW